MPKFTVRRRVDAYAIYEAEIEAENEMQAAELAEQDESKYDWGKPDVTTFDARSYTTVDADGWDIEKTTVGDL